MQNLPKLVLLASMAFFTSNGYPQVFGGDPHSLEWKQINTPSARIIFPQGLDSVANRIINIIYSIKNPTGNTIGHKSRKINLVLQNQTTISNGYVDLGPFRSEFLLTPYQNSFDLGSLPWPDQLTIHEYRHVEQYSNFNVGISKLMHTIFGQEGQALANNAAIPNWFFEGDAVFNETNVSKQGRGSLPSFYNEYRSLWQAGKDYSWMKLRNGSYKDFVPDHYRLGYMMVAYGREKYGDQFWEKVTQDAAAYKNLFYPFQHAIKKYTGLDYITFRNDALGFFKKQFDLQQTKNEGIKDDQKKSAYRDERYPSFTKNGELIFVKSTYQKPAEFVVKKGSIRQKIRQQDYSIDNYFSYRNGKIVYAAYQPDIRWGYRDFSDLRVVNVANGHQQTLRKNTKYFSPDISDDGKKIIAVNEPASGKYDMHLLSAQTGELIAAIPNPEKLFYSFPKFYRDDKVLSAVRNSEGKTSLALIDLDDGKTEYLLPFTFNVTGFPSIFRDTVYFSYSYKKNDELFAYSFSDKKIWRIQIDNEAGFGKYHPAVNDSDIVWAAFTAEGYRLNFAKKSALKYEEISAENLLKVTSSFGITGINNTNSNLLEIVSHDSFAITKYAKSFHLFNFHSIEPAINDPQYSISLISENILNTLQSDVSFTYDRSEKFKQIGFDATYAGWFPFLSAGVNYVFDRNAFYRGNVFHFNQVQPYAGFNIPLNFSKGRSFTFLNFGSQFVYSQNDLTGKYKDSLKSSSYSFGSNFLSFSHQVQKAQQQIFPSFAQTLSASFKSPFSTYKGHQLVISGNVYFPGFLRTHSTLLNFAYLEKDSLGQINFSSGFPLSRGYQSANLYRMYKWGINYQFPFLYPDAGFGNIIYLLRTRANFFYDDTRVRDFYVNQSSFKAKFRSAGAEIYFDTKWWNQASISFGLRYSYLFDAGLFGESKRNRFEIILPVNIFNQ